MVILGCNPPNRFIEQHDIFFGIAENIVDLRQEMYDFWPEAGEKIHIDAYRKVHVIGKHRISIVNKSDENPTNNVKLYFLNLGGYKTLDMEEYHYKQLVVADSMAEAINVAKSETFYKHHTSPHVDNKYGIDVDDAYLISDMLPVHIRAKYSIEITETQEKGEEDELTIGYLKLSNL